MSDTVTASFVGTPHGGDLDNPFPGGAPTEGERVALFAFEVKRVDDDSEKMRSYHVAPAAEAKSGPLGPGSPDAQGDTTQWVGFGTGTVISRDGMEVQVRPDAPING